MKREDDGDEFFIIESVYFIKTRTSNVKQSAQVNSSRSIERKQLNREVEDTRGEDEGLALVSVWNFESWVKWKRGGTGGMSFFAIESTGGISSVI